MSRHVKRSALTLYSLRNGQQNAGNEGFTVVRLLEDSDLLAKTRAGGLLVTPRDKDKIGEPGCGGW